MCLNIFVKFLCFCNHDFAVLVIILSWTLSRISKSGFQVSSSEIAAHTGRLCCPKQTLDTASGCNWGGWAQPHVQQGECDSQFSYCSIDFFQPLPAEQLGAKVTSSSPKTTWYGRSWQKTARRKVCIWIKIMVWFWGQCCLDSFFLAVFTQNGRQGCSCH